MAGNNRTGEPVCVLHSGGIDSTAVVLWYISKGRKVTPLYINYGNTTAAIEWKTCKKIAKLLDTDTPVRISSDISRIVPNNVLMSGKFSRSSDFKNQFAGEFFPNRNLYLITLASMYCYHNNINTIATGIIDGGSFGYPDTDSFFLKKTKTLFLHTLGLSVEAPLIKWSKQQVISYLQKKRFDINNTFFLQHKRRQTLRQVCVLPGKSHCIKEMKGKFKKYQNKPTFFPSISNDKTTWFWKKNIPADGLLMSYDVIAKNKAFKQNSKTIKKILGFNGMVIIDSGAFGQSDETDPEIVYARQKQLRPDIAILLDSIASAKEKPETQKAHIQTTLANAAIIKKINKNRVELMAVVQGTDAASIKYCAKRLSKLKFEIIGIPLSQFSKHRRYMEAIEKYLLIKKCFPGNIIFHGLGCGSRTLLAILAHLGVRFFDSSAFYKAAAHKEAVNPESFCSINAPGSKKECKACLLKQPVPKTFQDTVNYNLREVLKEVQRCRCAVEKKVTKEYLKEKRLSKNTWKKLAGIL